MPQPGITDFPVEEPGVTTQHGHVHASSLLPHIFAVCLTSVVVAVNYTNYGPLIPIIRTSLNIDNGQAGLLSTFLFLGLAVTYIPAGILSDRYGSRPVLIISSILFTLGGILLPLF